MFTQTLNLLTNPPPKQTIKQTNNQTNKQTKQNKNNKIDLGSMFTFAWLFPGPWSVAVIFSVTISWSSLSSEAATDNTPVIESMVKYPAYCRRKEIQIHVVAMYNMK